MSRLSPQLLLIVVASLMVISLIFALGQNSHTPSGSAGKEKPASIIRPAGTSVGSLSSRQQGKIPTPQIPVTSNSDRETTRDRYFAPELSTLDDSYDVENAFRAAAQEFDVPQDLLKTIGYIESRGEHRHGRGNGLDGYGVMRLRDTTPTNTLARAASLTGLEKSVLVRDPVQNIRGAAAVLRAYANAAKSENDPRPWLAAAVRMSGREGADADQYRANLETVLAEGLTHVTDFGSTFTVAAQQQGLL